MFSTGELLYLELIGSKEPSERLEGHRLVDLSGEELDFVVRALVGADKTAELATVLEQTRPNPGSILELGRRARSLLSAGQPLEAARLADEALFEERSSVLVLDLLLVGAIAHLTLSQFSEAAALLEDLVREMDKVTVNEAFRATALSNLATAYRKLNDPRSGDVSSDAVAALGNAIENVSAEARRYPSYLRLMMVLGNQLAALGRWVEGSLVFEELAEAYVSARGQLDIFAVAAQVNQAKCLSHVPGSLETVESLFLDALKRLEEGAETSAWVRTRRDMLAAIERQGSG